MTISRRDRKKLNTRYTIIDVAMRLFNEQTFQATSMEQIAEHSDISKATLYKYFEVKEAIIAAYWQELLKQTKPALQSLMEKNQDTRSRLVAMFQFIMQHIMRSRELYEIYISYRLANMTNPTLNQKLRSGVAEYLTTVIQAGQEANELRDDMPIEVMVSNVELLSTLQAMAWLRHPETFSVEASSNMLAELFLNGAIKHVGNA